MRMMQDTTKAIEGDETEALDLLLKPKVLETIQHAAALSGMDDAAFVAEAAHQRALAVIEATEVTYLTAEDYAVVLDAINNPRPPTEALKAAYRDYLKNVVQE
jgi:uncharacterized protein (DUF1778 family)